MVWFTFLWFVWLVWVGVVFGLRVTLPGILDATLRPLADFFEPYVLWVTAGWTVLIVLGWLVKTLRVRA